MRVLGIGDSNDLGSLYLTLTRQGHDVRVFVAESESHDALLNMVNRVDDWRSQLDWIRGSPDDAVILFETAKQGALQDALREDGFPVIGGSAYGDRLEGDRAFGQRIMRDVGMQTAAAWSFESFSSAQEFLARHPGRYVYKLSGAGFASTRTFVGEAPDGRDMCGYLRAQQRSWSFPDAPQILLMERLQGVEVGVGAFFDGTQFLRPVCLDWEHKRFFPGDLGEMTGEMGTLVTYRGGERLFEATLARMVEPLREGRYRGYINLNTIVNARGVWPLEFTCRFGYPGFAILQPLQIAGWPDLFSRVLKRRSGPFSTADGFSVGIVLTVPPFPYRAGYAHMSKGLPIVMGEDLAGEEWEHLHVNEVAIKDGELVTAGVMGYLMVVTGTGLTVESAQRAAYARLAKVSVPMGRFRNDIGDRFLRQDRALLEGWGWLSSRAWHAP